MTKNDLALNEYNPYYQQYIQKAGDVSLYEGLKVNSTAAVVFFESISEEKLELRYEAGKWTIKEVV